MQAIRAGARLNVGVVGLGFASTLTLPDFARDPRYRLVAGADPRQAARDAFESRFGARAVPSAEALCALPEVDLVYICTPPFHHREQAVVAAGYGKHILVEKPMALTVEDCDAMIEAADRAGVALIYGHTHSYDPPIRAMQAIVESGRYGPVSIVNSWVYTDLLYRARAPWELDVRSGGGAVFIQASHQIDIARLLVGKPVRSVSARTYCHDQARGAEGGYSAFLNFDGGATALFTYSGYGCFDSAELHGWVGEDGRLRAADTHAATHRARQSRDEQNAREARRFGHAELESDLPPHQPFFGLTLVTLAGADLRQTPDGLAIYTARGREDVDVPIAPTGRGIMLDEVYSAVCHGMNPRHDGRWGRDTLEVCVAIHRSSSAGDRVSLQ